MDYLNIVADILVKYRGSLDTSELTRIEAAEEIVALLTEQHINHQKELGDIARKVMGG